MNEIVRYESLEFQFNYNQQGLDLLVHEQNNIITFKRDHIYSQSLLDRNTHRGAAQILARYWYRTLHIFNKWVQKKIRKPTVCQPHQHHFQPHP